METIYVEDLLLNRIGPGKGEEPWLRAVTGLKAVKQALTQKSFEQEPFRQKLLTESKVTIEQEVEERLPAGLKVQVLEATPATLYLELPPRRVPASSPIGISMPWLPERRIG